MKYQILSYLCFLATLTLIKVARRRSLQLQRARK